MVIPHRVFRYGDGRLVLCGELLCEEESLCFGIIVIFKLVPV